MIVAKSWWVNLHRAHSSICPKVGGDKDATKIAANNRIFTIV